MFPCEYICEKKFTRNSYDINYTCKSHKIYVNLSKFHVELFLPVYPHWVCSLKRETDTIDKLYYHGIERREHGMIIQ